jgi:hypothetical protein
MNRGGKVSVPWAFLSVWRFAAAVNSAIIVISGYYGLITLALGLVATGDVGCFTFS